MIENKDIILRAIEETDLVMLYEMINDQSIQNMVGGNSRPISMYQQKNWFASIQNRTNELRLIIDTKNDGPIGVVMLTDINYINGTAETHIKLNSKKSSRGKGYGYKAYMTLFEYAFNNMNLNCIFCQILDYNIPSINLHLKCGFVKEGRLRQRVYKNGKYNDMLIFSLLKKDWEKLLCQN
ncbi:MAG: GNAT family N-acetyltransferase [Bacteroidales bacterium]|jgi:RimJ/RimL family protein N-acetyltransferase